MIYGCICNSIQFIFTHNKIDIRKMLVSCNIVVQEQFHFACLYRFFIATAITALYCWFYGVSQYLALYIHLQIACPTHAKF